MAKSKQTEIGSRQHNGRHINLLTCTY